MRKKLIILVSALVLIIIGTVWFIVDYNQRVTQAKKEAAEFAEKIKYPWRYREIKSNSDLMQVNMQIYYSDLSDEEKNKEAIAAYERYYINKE